MNNSANGDAEPASRFVEVGTILYTLTKLICAVQKAIDQRNLELAREFMERNATTLSLDENCRIHVSDQADPFSHPHLLPLYTLVSFQRYRIRELLVDFAVVADDGDLPGGQPRFWVVPLSSQAENAQPARFKVVAKERVFAQFEIAGEIKATLTLGEA